MSVKKPNPLFQWIRRLFGFPAGSSGSCACSAPAGAPSQPMPPKDAENEACCVRSVPEPPSYCCGSAETE